MGYVTAAFYINGNTSNCTTGYLWIPGQGRSIDSNDGKRTDITYMYLSNFGRYGEWNGGFTGLEGWLVEYVNEGLSYSQMNSRVRAGASGFDITARDGAKHVMIGPGSCPPPPVYGCTDRNATNYNSRATVDDGSCTYPSPTASLTVSPTSIIQGQNATLYWSTTNTSSVVTNFGSSQRSGSTTVSPSDDTTYRITAYGTYGGTAVATVTLVVYIPPVVSLSVDRDTIVQGESTVLRWSTTGDASTANISPGIGPSNLTSNINISPTTTTTYTISVSGLGGNDSAEVTVTVLPPPSVTLTGPISIDYGQSATINYVATNVSQSFVVTPYYYDLDGVETVGTNIVLPIGDNLDSSFTHTPPWGSRGPRQISYVALVTGAGDLTDTDFHIVNVNIDQMPNLIDIPESDDKIKSEEPVISPDAEVSTLELVVSDIDIPVEIKSDLPVQVEIDNSGQYKNVRSI